uniref:Glycosyltransferases n=1 Tax=Zea mays TaxID=4577 RepID=A0A804PR71_MAIZE
MLLALVLRLFASPHRSEWDPQNRQTATSSHAPLPIFTRSTPVHLFTRTLHFARAVFIPPPSCLPPPALTVTSPSPALVVASPRLPKTTPCPWSRHSIPSGPWARARARARRRTGPSSGGLAPAATCGRRRCSTSPSVSSWDSSRASRPPRPPPPGRPPPPTRRTASQRPASPSTSTSTRAPAWYHPPTRSPPPPPSPRWTRATTPPRAASAASSSWSPPRGRRPGPGARRRRRGELLRLAHTLRLVRPPVVWVVVEPAADAPATAEVLRGTGVMYRHLAFRPEGNLTAAGEAHAQRNAALAHVERHRLAGVLHFADAAAVYDVGFFDQIRQIEAFGAWPVATVSAGEKKVTVEGPLCSASEVVGWFSRDLDDDGTTRSVAYDRREADLDPAAAGTRARTTTIGVSGFAFNSSILWDPERWGRPASLPDTSQDSIKFVQEVVLEDRAKLS